MVGGMLAFPLAMAGVAGLVFRAIWLVFHCSFNPGDALFVADISFLLGYLFSVCYAMRPFSEGLQRCHWIGGCWYGGEYNIAAIAVFEVLLTGDTFPRRGPTGFGLQSV